MKTISSFRGQYFFLSNYFTAPVTYQGITFQNNEAAFHAMKCPSMAAQFATLPPDQAKKLGRTVQLRGDWESMKEQIMHEICLAKFTQNKDLGRKLVATGDAELIEGNTRIHTMTDYEIAKVSTRGLASAIILQAVLDYGALRPPDKEKKRELDKFFSSDWFIELCDICSIPPQPILRKINNGDFSIPANNLRSTLR